MGRKKETSYEQSGQTICKYVRTDSDRWIFRQRGDGARPTGKTALRPLPIKTFGVVNRYDLSEEFPALTPRPTAIKSAMDEILVDLAQVQQYPRPEAAYLG